jgi:hypothetical protein
LYKADWRSVDGINAGSSGTFSTKHFRIIQLVVSVGLILSIAGGSSSNGLSVPTTSKVGIILYILAFAAMVLVCVMSISRLSHVPTAERRICGAVLAAVPLIAVRILYSVLAVFLHNHLFNIYDGSVAVLIAMSVVEEFIVVFIYLFLGWFLPKIEAEMRGQIESRPWKANKGSGHRSYQRQEQQAPPQYQTPMPQGSPLPRYPMPFDQAHVRQDV